MARHVLQLGIGHGKAHRMALLVRDQLRREPTRPVYLMSATGASGKVVGINLPEELPSVKSD